MASALVRPISADDAVIAMLKRAERDQPIDLENRIILGCFCWNSTGFSAATELCGVATISKHGDTAEVEWVAGRRHREWVVPLTCAIENIARIEGLNKIVAFGRKGWKRALLQAGWCQRMQKYGMAGYEKAL